MVTAALHAAIALGFDIMFTNVKQYILRFPYVMFQFLVFIFLTIIHTYLGKLRMFIIEILNKQ